jgi:hypothetical protein
MKKPKNRLSLLYILWLKNKREKRLRKGQYVRTNGKDYSITKSKLYRRKLRNLGRKNIRHKKNNESA